jgi:hypothetical protein
VSTSAIRETATSRFFPGMEQSDNGFPIPHRTWDS